MILTPGKLYELIQSLNFWAIGRKYPGELINSNNILMFLYYEHIKHHIIPTFLYKASFVHPFSVLDFSNERIQKIFKEIK